jgi:hypothetical protein
MVLLRAEEHGFLGYVPDDDDAERCTLSLD